METNMKLKLKIIKASMLQITRKLILKICLKKKIDSIDQLLQETQIKNRILIKMETYSMKMIKKQF